MFPILCHFKHCNSIRLLTKRKVCTLSERAVGLRAVRPSRAACGACRQSGRVGSLRSCSFYGDKKKSACWNPLCCPCCQNVPFFFRQKSDAGVKAQETKSRQRHCFANNAAKRHQFVWTSAVRFRMIRERTTPPLPDLKSVCPWIRVVPDTSVGNYAPPQCKQLPPSVALIMTPVKRQQKQKVD